MSRRRKDPPRPLTDDERQERTRLKRCHAAPAVRAARAVMLLAVADGSDYQAAARAAAREVVVGQPALDGRRGVGESTAGASRRAWG